VSLDFELNALSTGCWMHREESAAMGGSRIQYQVSSIQYPLEIAVNSNPVAAAEI